MTGLSSLPSFLLVHCGSVIVQCRCFCCPHCDYAPIAVMRCSVVEDQVDWKNQACCRTRQQCNSPTNGSDAVAIVDRNCASPPHHPESGYLFPRSPAPVYTGQRSGRPRPGHSSPVLNRPTPSAPLLGSVFVVVQLPHRSCRCSGGCNAMQLGGEGVCMPCSL